MTHLWLRKLKKPPRSFDDYHPHELRALLLGQEAATAEITRIAVEEEERSQQIYVRGRLRSSREAKRTVDLSGPVITGDPVVDQWERQIADGHLPDWMTADG